MFDLCVKLQNISALFDLLCLACLQSYHTNCCKERLILCLINNYSECRPRKSKLSNLHPLSWARKNTNPNANPHLSFSHVCLHVSLCVCSVCMCVWMCAYLGMCESMRIYLCVWVFCIYVCVSVCGHMGAPPSSAISHPVPLAPCLFHSILSQLESGGVDVGEEPDKNRGTAIRFYWSVPSTASSCLWALESVKCLSLSPGRASLGSNNT